MLAIGATAGTGQSSATTKREAVGLSFNHWVRPELGVTVGATLLRANAAAGFGSASSTAIFPVLFGLSYSPRVLALTRSIRPYASVAGGPYICTANGATGAAASNDSEVVFGGRFATGANWFVARRFALNLEVQYHVVGEFERRDAVTKDPGGFGMNLGFALGWGG